MIDIFQYWKQGADSCYFIWSVITIPLLFEYYWGTHIYDWWAFLMESSVSGQQCDSQEEFPADAEYAGAPAK